MKKLKHVVGIDVAQKELVCTLGRKMEDNSIELYAYKVFSNDGSGFKALLSWVKKLTDDHTSVYFVLEATGVYHEKLAYYLDKNQYHINIVLPNKISNYIRTLETRTITDKTCSQAITRFGLERKLDLWKRPHTDYKILRQLTRERDQLIVERTVSKNQLHAETTEAEPNKNSLKRLKQRIRLLDVQEKEILQELKELVGRTKQIHNEVKILTSIPGIGSLTAMIILAETNGFDLIRNKKQLTCYAGLDVVEKQSGTSVRGKTRISKKGNKYLRKALYLPSMTSVRFDENNKNIYDRLVNKHGLKKKASVAVQRKMLELAYTLHKNKTEYAKNYNHQSVEQKSRVHTQMA